MEIGLNGIQSLVLQGIGPNFVGQPDTPTFLPQIEQHSSSFGSNPAQGRLELVSTVAAERAQPVTG